MNQWLFLIPLKKLKFAYEKGFAAPLVLPVKMQADPWLAAKRVLYYFSVFFLDSGGVVVADAPTTAREDLDIFSELVT
jgi:hypothetical protein